MPPISTINHSSSAGDTKKSDICCNKKNKQGKRLTKLYNQKKRRLLHKLVSCYILGTYNMHVITQITKHLMNKPLLVIALGFSLSTLCMTSEGTHVSYDLLEAAENYIDGVGADRDVDRSVQLFEDCILSDYPETIKDFARIHLSMIYLFGLTGTQDLAKARSYLKRKYHSEATRLAGQIYLSFFEKTYPTWDRCSSEERVNQYIELRALIKLCTEAAKTGNFSAMRYLGTAQLLEENHKKPFGPQKKSKGMSLRKAVLLNEQLKETN